MMHTGSITFARPSIGAWVSYGLGTVNRNLPSFLVLAPAVPYAGDQTWGSDFLPGCHQGTRVVPGPTPIADLAAAPPSPPCKTGAATCFERSTRTTSTAGPATPSWPRACGRSRRPTACSRQAPEAFDLSKESDATLAPLRPAARQQTRASAGSAWSPAGWPSAACASSS